MSTQVTERTFAKLQARMRGGVASTNGPARAKYGNKKVKGFDALGNVLTFDSKREAKRWAELLVLQKNGQIGGLERQIPYHFGDPPMRYVGSNRKVKYVLDFRYIEVETGEWAHEDAKGFRTPEFKLKQAMMEHFHGIEVLEV